MKDKGFSEISCPKCGKRFHASKPRTKKQWKVSLFTHLVMPPRHNLKPEEASSIADRYLESL